MWTPLSRPSTGPAEGRLALGMRWRPGQLGGAPFPSKSRKPKSVTPSKGSLPAGPCQDPGDTPSKRRPLGVPARSLSLPTGPCPAPSIGMSWCACVLGAWSRGPESALAPSLLAAAFSGPAHLLPALGLLSPHSSPGPPCGPPQLPRFLPGQLGSEVRSPHTRPAWALPGSAK